MTSWFIKKFEIAILLISDMGSRWFEKFIYVPFDREFHGESNGAWRKNASLLVMTSWFIKILEIAILLISDLGQRWFEKLKYLPLDSIFNGESNGAWRKNGYLILRTR